MGCKKAFRSIKTTGLSAAFVCRRCRGYLHVKILTYIFIDAVQTYPSRLHPRSNESPGEGLFTLA